LTTTYQHIEIMIFLNPRLDTSFIKNQLLI